MNSENAPTSRTPMERVREYLPLLYLIAALFALRWTFVEPYVVPTGSMEPTLKTGDRLYALKCAYDVRFPFTDWTLFKVGTVKRGDVILFIPPHETDKTYVKRAIGLPGDDIEFRSGVLFINGEEISKDIFPNREIMYDIQDAENKSLYLEKLGDVKHYAILDNASPDFRNFPPPPGEARSAWSLEAKTKVPEGFLFAVGDNRDHSYDSRGWGWVPMESLKGRAMFIWFSMWESRIRYERIGTLIQ